MKKRILVLSVILSMFLVSMSFAQNLNSGLYIATGTPIWLHHPGKSLVNKTPDQSQNIIVLSKDTPILKILQASDSGIDQVLVVLDQSSKPIPVWVLRTSIDKK